MIKSLVGRLSGKKEPAREAAQSSPAPQKAPRKEQSHQPHSEKGQHHEASKQGKGRNRRQSKPKAAAAPWSVEQFQVEEKEG